MALVPDIPVEVQYRPYFLNPWVPREGIGRDAYLTKKFGSPARYEQIAQRVAAAAAGEGLTYAVGKLARQPNTLDCHRLIYWAQAAGKAAAMKQRLMELYFSEGGDLSDPEVLVQAAVDCGLDREDIRGRLASDEDADEIARAAASAQQAGIDGVPFFVFSGAFAVSGAQSPEYLAGAIKRAAEEVAKREAVPAK